MDNVVRHARAKRVSIRLNVDQGTVRLAIADDGEGITETPAGRSGRGLIDMRTAAADIGASLDVVQPGRGTAIQMRWPRAPR
jgi:signal transduction histidine kinase